jgi:hypothetical protein
MRRSASSGGIGNVDLHDEAVKLRFGQRIGAFLLDRVLRGQHMERLGRRARAGHGDVLFLHGLQQGRLRARAGAVDFVRHQQAGRTPGPMTKRKDFCRLPVRFSSTSEPRISAGIRSGVN